MVSNQAKLRLGYAIEPGKRERFFDKFMGAKCKNIDFIDMLTPLAASRTDTRLPGCEVCVHKLSSYEPNLITNGLAASGVPLVDPIASIAVLEDRAATAASLEAAFAGQSMDSTCVSVSVQAEGAAEDADQLFEVAVPPYTILAPFMAEEDIRDVFEIHGIEFPVIIKPRAARSHGGIYIVKTAAELVTYLRSIVGEAKLSQSWLSSASLMSSMTSWLSVNTHESSKEQADAQFFVQQYLPHGGILWKVCVIGKNIIAQQRKSVEDDFIGAVPRVSKESAKDSLAFPRGFARTLLAAAETIQQCLRLTLFNFDVVVARGSEEAAVPQYYVVDVNFFPSFADVPRVYDLLEQHLNNVAGRPVAPGMDKIYQFPAVANWVPPNTAGYVLQSQDLPAEPAPEPLKPTDASVRVTQTKQETKAIVQPNSCTEVVDHTCSFSCGGTRKSALLSVGGAFVGFLMAVGFAYWYSSRKSYVPVTSNQVIA